MNGGTGATDGVTEAAETEGAAGHDGAYRPGVGMMLLNRDGQVLVGKRLDVVSDAWQMPQGGIDDGEGPADAAARELKEEVGTSAATIIGESRGWYTYDLPGDLGRTLWQGRYRGQRQKWFVMRLDGPESDVTVDTEEPEFSAFKWIEPARLPDVIVPFKRDLYLALVAEFAPILKR